MTMHRETLHAIREKLKALVAQQLEHKALMRTPHGTPAFAAAHQALAEKHTGLTGNAALWHFGWHTRRAELISALLTCHRDLRGKPAGHGMEPSTAWLHLKLMFQMERPTVQLETSVAG